MDSALGRRMKGLLVDNNLPDSLRCWQGEPCEFVKQLGATWTDSQIWEHARTHDLAIVTKDSDFSHRMLASQPPPRVLHIHVRNQRLSVMDEFMAANWPAAKAALANHKLVTLHADRLECVS